MSTLEDKKGQEEKALKQEEEKDKEYPVNMTVSVAYDTGNQIAALVTTKKTNDEECEAEDRLLTKLDAVIPPELIQYGPEDYLGDVGKIVAVSLSYNEVELIGDETLLFPSGRELVRLNSLPVSEIPLFNAIRNHQIQSLLSIEQAFVDAGGMQNGFLRTRALEHLS